MRSIQVVALAMALAACDASGPQPASGASPSSGAPASASAATASETAPPAAPMDKRAPGQENEPLLAYRVVGTEPFWGVRVDGDMLHFTTLEDQTGKQLSGRHTTTPNGIHYEGEQAGVVFALDLERAVCSDGMSDTEYEYKAAFRYGEQRYSGCAEGAK